MAQVYIGNGVTTAAFWLGVFVFGGLVALKAFDPAMYSTVTVAAGSVLNDFMNAIAQALRNFFGSFLGFF
jgi:hypothetical protein